MKLTIELIPQSSFNSNLRSSLPRREWDRIRKKVYQRANHRCQICGETGRNGRVECHELWDFNTKKKVQKLVGLIALCPRCHEVKHFGLAEIRGWGDQAFEHLMKVNQITRSEADRHIRESFELWETRSSIEWTLDTTWLKGF